MTFNLTIQLADRLTSVSNQEWAALFPAHPDPYALVRFVEDVGMEGFQFQSLVVRDANRPILLVPLFRTVMNMAAMADGAVRIAAGSLRAYGPLC